MIPARYSLLDQEGKPQDDHSLVSLSHSPPVYPDDVAAPPSYMSNSGGTSQLTPTTITEQAVNTTNNIFPDKFYQRIGYIQLFFCMPSLIIAILLLLGFPHASAEYQHTVIAWRVFTPIQSICTLVGVVLLRNGAIQAYNLTRATQKPLHFQLLILATAFSTSLFNYLWIALTPRPDSSLMETMLSVTLVLFIAALFLLFSSIALSDVIRNARAKV